jgi:pimeloyl-ACP methyl ester carboxylesterase
MGIVYTLRSVMSRPFVQRRVDALLDAVEEKAHANKPGHNESSEKPSKTEEEKAQRRATLLRLMAEEPYRQGPDAAVLEAELLSAQDWGFEFAHVDFKPVWIWHGTKDGNAPISMLRYLAERVPNSALVEFENDTHYTMGAHIEQALDELMPQKPEEEK